MREVFLDECILLSRCYLLGSEGGGFEGECSEDEVIEYAASKAKAIRTLTSFGVLSSLISPSRDCRVIMCSVEIYKERPSLGCCFT
jgi:hypothetical protein